MRTRRSVPVVLIISGPSGGGKTTVCERLLASSSKLSRVITCTTRPPRGGERDGVDYYFLDEAGFRRRLDQNEFLEHANVHGHLYGTLKEELRRILSTGRDVLMNVDVQGAETVRRIAPTVPEIGDSLVSVFLTPGDLAVLRERLERRGKDSPEIIARRLAAAREEIAQWEHFDYLVMSTTADEDLRRMQVIYEAEQMRVSRASSPDL